MFKILEKLKPPQSFNLYSCPLHVGRPHDASRPWAAALLEPGHHGANLPHRSSRPAAATATTGAEYNTPNELWCSVWVSDAHCRSIFVAWHAVLLAACCHAPTPCPSHPRAHAHHRDNMVLQMSPAKAAVYGYLGPGGTSVTVSVASGGNVLYTVRAWLACMACIHAC